LTRTKLRHVSRDLLPATALLNDRGGRSGSTWGSTNSARQVEIPTVRSGFTSLRVTTL